MDSELRRGGAGIGGGGGWKLQPNKREKRAAVKVAGGAENSTDEDVRGGAGQFPRRRDRFRPAAQSRAAAERGRAAPARRKQRGGVGRRGVGDARVVAGADLAGGGGRELRGGKREAARAGKKNGGGERCAGTGMG